MSASDFLAGDGALASYLSGFQPRSQQQEMAERIESIIDARGILVVEAGTGVGKTFAYLVPAIESGKRVIIATGTKNLQDQLFHNDLPVIRKAMSLPVTVSLLKGRSNYLCQHRLEMHISAGCISRVGRPRGFFGRLPVTAGLSGSASAACAGG